MSARPTCLTSAESDNVILVSILGIACTGPLITTSAEDFENCFRINTLGPLVLFQSFRDLLIKSTKPEKKFVITSSLAASITAVPQVPFPIGAYGASKAAGNYVAAKLQQEHGESEKIAVISIHPGK